MGQTDESPPDQPPVLSPARIVVQLRPGAHLPEIPGLTWQPVFTSSTDDEEKHLEERAADLDPDYDPREFSQFFFCDLSNERVKDRDKLFDLLTALQNTGGVQAVDLEQVGPDPGVLAAGILRPDGCSCGPDPPARNPRNVAQGYLDRAPKGIDARYAVKLRGGDGKGQRFIDLERGWNLNHEDLTGQKARCLFGNPTVRINSRPHGTSVLGVVCAVDNRLGCLGIVPRLKSINVVSLCDNAGVDVPVARAIRKAAARLTAGDVLLLELQAALPVRRGPTVGAPIEVFHSAYTAICHATARGIIVIEPGGNGTNNGSPPAVNLDTLKNSHGKLVLFRDPGNHDFRDSGAIIVSAATSGSIHMRLPYAPHGKRIDCYAWGENITTLSSPPLALYTRLFAGTSGAAAIIAGAALAVQGRALEILKRRYNPLKLRKILSDAATGTPSASPGSTPIGVMPDLRAIFRTNGLATPP